MGFRDTEFFIEGRIEVTMTIAGLVSLILPLLFLFLVACYATLHPALSIPPSVGLSVGLSLGPSHFTFFLVFAVFGLTAPAQMIK